MNVLSVVTAICTATAIAAFEAAAGGEACHPIAAREIERQWEHYRSLSGARDSGGSDKYQCMEIESTKALVCRTTSANPAHPSIVIRTIIQDDRGISLKMEADTGANCEAFLGMMKEFQALNEKVREAMQNRGPAEK